MTRRARERPGNLRVLPGGGGGDLERPSWLSDAASAEWDRVAPALRKLGMAEPADETALAAYCEAVARLRIASDIVMRTGLVGRDKDTGALKRNPAVALARDASYEVRMWAREFGLTPAARLLLRHGHLAGAAPDDVPDPGRPRHSATDSPYGGRR